MIPALYILYSWVVTVDNDDGSISLYVSTDILYILVSFSLDTSEKCKIKLRMTGMHLFLREEF